MPGLNEDYKKKLIDRYVAGKATQDELLAFFGSLAANELDSLIEEHMANEISSILKEQQITGNHKKSLWKYIAAASILLFLGLGYYYSFNKAPIKRQIAKNQKHDIAPGGNRAILTLSNGRTINLGAAKNGKLANQGSAIINKNTGGQITYVNSEYNSSAQNNGFNIITTPRGGQYQLVLADGTKVWLNAASSIKYPVVFNGNERKVELTGEAYFEVAHNKEKPFKVISNGQEIEVLGTHFNINAYTDENVVKTTLLEGSVKVTAGGKNKMLKPGEQARLEKGNILVADVDVNEAIAWKNGFFQFKDNNIRAIMQQLGRWYDVDIKYEGNLPEREFSGAISRNVNLSQILYILSFKEIHFKIEKKTITVMP